MIGNRADPGKNIDPASRAAICERLCRSLKWENFHSNLHIWRSLQEPRSNTALEDPATGLPFTGAPGKDNTKRKKLCLSRWLSL